MNIIEWALLIINGLYIPFTIILFYGWLKIRKKGPIASTKLFITIVIVVRDEAENISGLLADLYSQSYPLFEVIIVDDHSTDNTIEIIKTFCSKNNFTVKLLELKNIITKNPVSQNFKKAGIEAAVSQANGDIILNTDGDCRVGPGWVASFASFYESANAECVSGPVTFSDEQNIFEKAQVIEFASLMASGAATLSFGFPSMCNGANFSYTKFAFTKVNGYLGTSEIPSGDDIFLMQKIYKLFPGKIFFNKCHEAIVSTAAQPNFNKFFNQRIRWAGKWNMYKDWKISALALFVFLGNASLLLCLIFSISMKMDTQVLKILILLRFGVEIIFLIFVLNFLNKIKLVFYIPLVQVFYFLYVIFFGLISVLKKKYVWKGREI